MYNHILFLDIETVAQKENYSLLHDNEKSLWQTKANNILKNSNETAEAIYGRAAIYAEFGKIICISCGFINKSVTGQNSLKIKSFYGHNERELLTDFLNTLAKLNSQFVLCAHNGKEFDFPYLSRRILINKLKLPEILNLAGKKPWDIKHLDTMELWKFGDYKAYTSLNLLAHVFNIPTPKSDIDGSMVGEVYYKEKNLQRIVNYCQKDVATLVNVFLSINGHPTISDNNIITS
jgi:3'-5' exonuclease